MMKSKYSEKEKLIFSGVLKLAHSGQSLEKITAQQIADSAGVGKATIYDYFSSKDEIIAKAILYFQRMEMDRFKEYIDSLSTFKEKVYSIYDTIANSLENSASIFNTAIGFDTPCKILNRASISPEERESMLEPFYSLFYELIDTGNKTKSINIDISKEENKFYMRMVLFGNASAVSRELTLNELSRKTIFDNAYKMLITALN